MPFKSLLASVGVADHGTPHIDATVCIISTGDEHAAPGVRQEKCMIPIQQCLVLEHHGFNSITAIRVNDTSGQQIFFSIQNRFEKCAGNFLLLFILFRFGAMEAALKEHFETNPFLICSGRYRFLKACSNVA